MCTEFMEKIDASNPLFSLASELVHHTSKNIFLTGRAGTGKTTFLRYIRENCPKQLAIVAPTGVAAINAGGVTIHSFFQLPLSPFIPEVKGFAGGQDVINQHTLLARLRLNSERRKVLQELELLIIDEISMVRCDVLDAIDLVLRHVRYRHRERFGGVQLLFIGDMFQLPPVVREQEWNILKEHYGSPYFFDSHVVRDDPPVYLEFTKIYRQTEKKFIDLLNKVRNNEMNEDDLNALHERYQPDLFGNGAEGYIVLTTHNDKAKEINSGELAKLPGKVFTYRAGVENEFPATAFPAEELLHLKTGAQVMFIRNDTDKGRKYYNGKIGVVTELSEDKIFVHCEGDPEPIEVRREKWENIRYTVDRSTRQLNEDVLGSFSQYPLRLAWAITIHKSQGLTFKKAVIDAGKAFAPGQVYVALSRCTSLEGLILHSRIWPNGLNADNRVVQFTRNALSLEGLQQELVAAKKAYQQKLFSSLFEFSKEVNEVKKLQDYLLQHTSSFNRDVHSWCEELLKELQALQSTAEKFKLQLKRLFALAEKAEENRELQERMKAGSGWFMGGIKSAIDHVLKSPAVTDSTTHAKEFNETLREVYSGLVRGRFLLDGFAGKFSTENFHSRKNNFLVPSFPVNAYAGVGEKKVDLPHPALYQDLRKLRDSICQKNDLPIYLVAGSKTLEEMTAYLPQTAEELEQISGFGRSKLEAYGKDFLAIISKYSLENGLTSRISEKAGKRKRRERKEPRTNTREETFRLYKQGKSVQEIANERKLAVPTIEGHLAYFVANGLVRIEELVGHENFLLIEPEARTFTGGSISSIREKLGNRVSFGEIRLVLAWAEYQRSSSHVDH